MHLVFREDKGTGYMYCYMPGHYCANNAGKVLEHVYVMSEHIGRPLQSGECVHHKDRNRKNNKLDNLELMTIEEHSKLHALEDRGGYSEDRVCLFCEKIFTVYSSIKIGKFCSYECSNLHYRKFEVDKETLEKLVWEVPTTEVAKILGVSDKAVEKRCKLFGINKPPRGYWAKKRAGKI